MTRNIRKNSITGLIETDNLTKVSMTFSEWWNGEGLDFDFGDKRIELHSDELHAMFVAAAASGFVDWEEVMVDAKDLRLESEERARQIESFAKNY